MPSSASKGHKDNASQAPDVRLAARQATLKDQLARLEVYREAVRSFRDVLDSDQKAIFDARFAIDKRVGF